MFQEPVKLNHLKTASNTIIASHSIAEKVGGKIARIGSVGYPQIIPGVVTVCSYPTDDFCEFCDRRATIPYTSVSSVTVAPQYPTLL